MRAMGRILLGIGLLAALVACTPHSPGLTATPPSALTPVDTEATPSPGPNATPAPSPTPAGPLPAVVAQLSFSLPGGDGYSPQTLAFDETGRAVVVCYESGASEPASALALVDPQSGTRGPVWQLPGHSLGPAAAAGGSAYVGYDDAQGRQHLAAVDLETGQVRVDVLTDFLYYGDTMVVDAAGRLHIPLKDRLEVRDGATLDVLRTLPYEGQPADQALAADLASGRLYLAVGDQLRAYRAADLALLWEAPGLLGQRRLVVDQAGRRVYVRCEGYEGGEFVVRLLAFDAASGQALGRLSPGEGSGWELVAADSQAGTLTFAESLSAGVGVRLWQTDLDGRPTGVSASSANWGADYGARDGRLLAVVPSDHLVRIFSLADLRLLGEVPTGVELRNVVADPDHERVYVNDSAGRVHAVDTRTYQVEGSVAAGRGPLVLDAPNGLLFASRDRWGREVAVVSTDALTVTATITGGYRVAVDSAGRRAFVGWTEMRDQTPGEVQVWDTRTFSRVATIAHRGEPAYNPLRDEVYLNDYSAYVVDGNSLAVVGELTPDIGETPPGMHGCTGCKYVTDITVDTAADAIIVSTMTGSTGGGPGSIDQPRQFSASTREPVTHSVTVLQRCSGNPAPFIIPPDGGLVYEAQHYTRYVAYNGALAYAAGAAEPSAVREGLPLNLYLPGQQVGLSAQNERLLAFDAATWTPLGWMDSYCIGEMDLARRRLYAWEQAQLTVLSFEGGQPLPIEPPEPVPAEWRSRGFGVQEIILSPDLASDRTVFKVVDGEIQRSTDGGASWVTLRGGLPPRSLGIIPSLSLAPSPAYAQDHTLFLAGRVGEPVGYGVWRSTDGGDTWTPLWSGLEHLRVERIVVSPRYDRDRTLLAYCQYSEFWHAASGTSLFRSTDGGDSWQRLATCPSSGSPPPLPQPAELLPYPDERTLFRVSEMRDTVERSSDGGQTWEAVLSRPDFTYGPRAVARSPLFERDRQVFVLYEDRLYRSTDGGTTWEAASDANLVRTEFEQHFTTLTAGRLDGERVVVFVGDYPGAVLPLEPGQLHWTPVAPPPPTAAPPAPATAAPTATPCPPPLARFAGAYARWAARLGCPTEAGAEVQWAGQRFEHGLVLWRGDTRQIYVLTAGDGAATWASYSDTWQEGMPDRDPSLQAPPGCEQPIRGFGKVWREQLGGPQAALGWAVEGEQGYGDYWQPCTSGQLVAGPDGRAYALFGDGHWDGE